MRKAHLIIIAVILLATTIAIFAAFTQGLLEPDLPQEIPTPAPEAYIPLQEPLVDIIEVTRVQIEMDSTVIERGTRFLPNVIIYPEDATDKRFELSSDNEDVIRLQGNYWIAAGTGSARLIATATNGVTSSAWITVNSPPATIYFSQEEVTLNRGDILTLEFTRREQWGQDDGQVEFATSDESVVTVSEDGTITAVGEGLATITIGIDGSYSTLEIVVVVPVSAIEITISRQVFSIGERVEFSVQTTPDDPTDGSYTVALSGVVVNNVQTYSFTTAVAGEVIITVTASNGVSESRIITVHDLDFFASEVIRLTNAERAIFGLATLTPDPTLMQAAEVRAHEIVDYFSHTRPDGRSFATSFEEANVPEGRWAENLAAGQRSPPEALEGWMGSQGHREAILDELYNYIGVGVVMDENGRLYWTQTFRS